MDIGYHRSKESRTTTELHGDPNMLYAVTIEPLNATFFVTERPDDDEWEVQEGVELEMSPLYGTWTPDLGPLRQTLCVSTSDPKHFQIFMHSKDITNRDFRPTGRRFGGFFSKAAWERFAREVPAGVAFLRIGEQDAIDATEEVAAVK